MKHVLFSSVAVLLLFSGCKIGTGGMAESACSGFAADEAGAAMAVNSPFLGSDDIAQSFVPSADGTLSTVRLPLNAIAPSTDTVGGALQLTLEGDSGNQPDGVALGTATIESSKISKTQSLYYTFTFAAPVQVDRARRYWLRLGASYGVSSTHYIVWKGSNSDIDPNGRALYLQRSTGQWIDFAIGSKRDLPYVFDCDSE